MLKNLDARGGRLVWILFVLALLAISTAGCTRRDNNSRTPTPATIPGTPETFPPPNTTDAAHSGIVQTPPEGEQPPGGLPLVLTVTSPQDGATVDTPEILVTGESIPEAVVTVNDDILIVGEDGQFESMVVLEEGPNLIEIIASDVEGNEMSLELAVVYEP